MNPVRVLCYFASDSCEGRGGAIKVYDREDHLGLEDSSHKECVMELLKRHHGSTVGRPHGSRVRTLGVLASYFGVATWRYYSHR